MKLLRLNKASSPLSFLHESWIIYTLHLRSYDVGEDVLRLNYFHDTGRRAMDTANERSGAAVYRRGKHSERKITVTV